MRTAPIDPLEIGVRRIRRVEPPDVPYPAARAVIGDGDPVLLVDALELAEWPGWRATGAQHLLAPVDVLRRSDGHDAVISDLREPCTRTVGVRDEADAGWMRGEAVTCVVSMLRGLSEAVARGLDGDESIGDWWITVDGRPVFAFSHDASHGHPISPQTCDLLKRIQLACDDRVIVRIIDDALDAAEHPAVLVRRAEEIEAALFEAAAPQPIEASAVKRPTARAARSIDVAEQTDGGTIARIRDAIERHVDARVGETVSGVLRSIVARRERVKRPPDPRAEPEKKHHGRVLAIGLAAASAVLVAGMLWPAGEGSTAETPPDPPRTATPTPSPHTASEPTPTVAATDPVAAASVVLDEWASCGAECDAAQGIERAGAVAAAEPSIDVVDDYGEVVLFIVRAEGESDQLLVLERSGDRWRIRDVFDAPCEGRPGRTRRCGPF